MLNPNTGERELAYVVNVDAIEPIVGSDNCEAAVIGGWRVMVKKGEFKSGDKAVYFEIDSKVDPENPAFEFLAKKHFAVKTQKYTFGGKGNFISQGLIMRLEDLGIEAEVGEFLTEQLKVTYYVPEDNARKSNKVDPNVALNRALARHPKIAKKYGKTIKNNKFARGLFMFFFGKKKASDTAFPTKFPYIKKTDQERCENMTWVLNDKTPFIVTQKCDGSSGTYILARTHKVFGKKFEFYVCSRNVRQLTPDQKSFYEDNYYWECAIKYDIEAKLKDYLEKHPELEYVCWQGEVCAPSIQSNPHGLTETHLFCFHMIDSVKGKYDMREAIKIWKDYGMETVPVVDENYILPDDFESFKFSADGFYDASVCEGKTKQTREGLVYYKTTDPAFSFKNVSRTYLLNHNT